MVQALVTIGIATYNRAASLQEYSLPSIEKLTYPRYEVIVIDDFSSDETPEILSYYHRNLAGFRFFRNDRNQGVCYSRNRILEESKGDIIVFFDDDVSIFPDCLDEIVKLYSKDPKVLFAWGCVYQCHGSHDRHEATFGTGSLFSVKHIVAKHFRFDTNIRYFKTYACEEHDFARRVQRADIKIIEAPRAKANHYQSPAKNRPWRGLGGDLNRLYEKVKVKQGSIFEYYRSLILGVAYETQYLLKYDTGLEDFKHQKVYSEAVRAFHNFLVQIKRGKPLIAIKYLFYVIIDIPIRAWIKGKIEAKQLHRFTQEMKDADNKGIQAESPTSNGSL